VLGRELAREVINLEEETFGLKLFATPLLSG
jgi:hypothetical protein